MPTDLERRRAIDTAASMYLAEEPLDMSLLAERLGVPIERLEAGYPLRGALLPGETTLVDFTASDASAHFRDMLALIDGGPAALDAARALLAKPGKRTAKPAAEESETDNH